MNADGTDRRRLTTYPKDDKTSQWHDYHAGPPRWVKKHNFITYQSVQNGKSSLFAVTLDGKKQWKLTNNELAEGWHDWSPDGKWLAIDMNDRGEKEFGIFLMNWKTKEIKKLTNPKDFKSQLSPVFVEVK
jgi:TolB protein